MKILVTGGTGFLGQALVRRLQAMGHTVTALGRNRTMGKRLIRYGVQFIPLDLADETGIIEACAHQAIVFHCGALSSPWGKTSDFYKANVLGTRYIAQGCLKHGVERLIHVSSPSIYCNGRNRLNIRETDPLPETSINQYARTKRLAEQEINRAFEAGLFTLTLRPRALFGPGDQTILPRLIRANQKFGIPLIDDGQALVDLTYIENSVDALLCALQTPQAASGQNYNISNGSPVRIKHVLTQLFQALNVPLKTIPLRYAVADGLARILEGASKTLFFGQEPLFTRYTIAVLAKSQTLDITAARQVLGYQPKVSIEEGLRLFADGWKNEQKQHKQREDKPYSWIRA